MKKTTTKVTIILLLLLVGVVGVYAFLSERSRAEASSTPLTAVQKVLYRDLSRNYPATPREVIKYYTEIEKCLYAQDTTDEELEQLGLRARELYDAELLAANDLENYQIRLKADVQQFKEKKRTITNVAVASTVNVDTFQEDGYDFARISCDYNVMEGSVNNAVSIVYLLRRDENRLWKIYGWDDARNVHVGGEE